ncbi:transglutaminase family protein [Alteromonas sp. NFXS44]
MKRFRVNHQTTYNFIHEVELSAHTLRLRPREGHDQHIESSVLNITPATTLKWYRDTENNSVAIARFSGSTRQLSIVSDSVVQKFDLSPQDFLLENYAVNYPFYYEPEDRISLSPYLQDSKLIDCSVLTRWVAKVRAPVQPVQTFELLLLLNQHIYTTISYEKRDEEGVQSSLTTVTKSKGSCRDLANLFIDTARNLGFAARFVSGYVYTKDSPVLPGTTHAWAEVFIPGAGWKGFDPTHGSLAGANHIAVAVSRLPELVPPISGAFRGQADASLKVEVWVTEIS